LEFVCLIFWSFAVRCNLLSRKTKDRRYRAGMAQGAYDREDVVVVDLDGDELDVLRVQRQDSLYMDATRAAHGNQHGQVHYTFATKNVKRYSFVLCSPVYILMVDSSFSRMAGRRRCGWRSSASESSTGTLGRHRCSCIRVRSAMASATRTICSGRSPSSSTASCSLPSSSTFTSRPPCQRRQ
jgi:hypothetical protein